MKLKRNLHLIDRAIRVPVSLICIYYGFVDMSAIGNTIIAVFVGVFGLVNLVAAATSHCPVYNMAGLSTYRDSNNTEQK